MRDDLTGLRALSAVAAHRSFTAAATELGVTPSAVSQTITTLESRTGVRLVQRTTRSVALTEAGARFVAQLAPALAEVTAALASLEQARDRPAGLLRLRMPRYAYVNVLEPRLAGFLAAYPDIAIDIAVADDAIDLVREGFDAGIQLGEVIGRDMIAVRVSGEQRIAVVGAPGYFAARGKPKHPRDLRDRDHDCIGHRDATTGAQYRWEFTEPGTLRELEVAVRGRLTMSDRELTVNAAIAGLGLAYVAESRVRAPLRDKQLVRVLADWCPSFPGLFLYYPSRANLAPKLRALVDFVKRPTGRPA